MTEKELEKHNFLTWCRYATIKDLERVKRENNEVCERLYSKYADEIKIMRYGKGRIVNRLMKSE